MKKTLGYIALVSVLLSVQFCKLSQHKHEAEWKSLKQHEVLVEKYADAIPGIYSFPAMADEWYPWNMCEKEIDTIKWNHQAHEDLNFKPICIVRTTEASRSQ